MIKEYLETILSIRKILLLFMSTTPWTDTELKECIKAYFKMMHYEKNGTPYVKSEINKELRYDSLKNRTKASIEYRMQNISSVLQEHKLDYLNGYKPANNVGANVKERIWKIVAHLKFSRSLDT